MAAETGSFREWQPDTEEATRHIKDQDMKQHVADRWQHTKVSTDEFTNMYSSILTKHGQKIYDCFLRHGWPDAFDKAACRAEVIELEKEWRTVEQNFLDAENPDAGFFD
jgi:hypothetical protein